MDIAYMAKQIGLPVEEVQELLALPPADIYASHFYRSLVEALDYHILSAAMPEVRAAYDQYLPAVVDRLRSDYQYMGRPMTSSTLSNWVLGFLHEPAHLGKMVDLHSRVPMQVLEYSLPEILSILDTIGSAGEEWKRAIVVMSLPLFASA